MSETVNVTLGGEELVLVRPRGRAGRKYVARIQSVLKSITPALGLVESGRDLTPSELDVMLDATGNLFLDESLKFEDEILPGLYMYSELGLTREKALDKLEELEIVPMEALTVFITAASFWITPPTREQAEALEESVKKSEEDQAEE